MLIITTYWQTEIRLLSRKTAVVESELSVSVYEGPTATSTTAGPGVEVGCILGIVVDGVHLDTLSHVTIPIDQPPACPSPFLWGRKLKFDSNAPPETSGLLASFRPS